jgi:FkbM family methyltransferase
MTLAALLDRYFIKQPKLRRFLTRSVYGSSLVPVSLLGAEIVISSELENGYLRAFQKAKWLSLFRDEASVLINLASLIDHDCTFVDAGANVGIYSAIISRLAAVKRNVSVMAFEVDPDTFVRLSENARRYGFGANNVGLAECEKSVEFIRGAVSHVTTAAQLKSRYNIAGETFMARCRPLSAFDMPGASIVLKIDVEGAEYEVLTGARPFFAAGRIKAVYLDGFSRPDRVLEFLDGFGLRLLDGRTLRPFGPQSHSLLAVRAAG